MDLIPEAELILISGGVENFQESTEDRSEALIKALEYSLIIGSFTALLAKPFGIMGMVSFGSIGAVGGFCYGYYSYA